MSKVIVYVGSNYNTPVGTFTWSHSHVEQVVAYFLTQQGIDSYTYSWVTGVWKEKKEQTLCIQVYTDKGIKTFRYICARICELLQQESILLDHAGYVEFVGGSR